MGVGMLPLVGWQRDSHSCNGAIRAHLFLTPSIYSIQTVSPPQLHLLVKKKVIAWLKVVTN